MSVAKAAIFDVFGTVVDYRRSVSRALQQWGEARGIERDWDAMADAWRDEYQPSMEPIRAGQRGYVNLDVLHRENLDRVLVAFDLDCTPAHERDALNLAWHQLDPWDDVVNGLNRLRTRLLIGPCSNGNIALMVHLARYAQLPWDTVLGAEIAQDYKPSHAVYIRSTEALGIRPDECLMVAAHNDDLRAARDAGLQTAFIARPLEHGPGQTLDLCAEEDWTFVASDFGDLATQLGC